MSAEKIAHVEDLRTELRVAEIDLLEDRCKQYYRKRMAFYYNFSVPRPVSGLFKANMHSILDLVKIRLELGKKVPCRLRPFSLSECCFVWTRFSDKQRVRVQAKQLGLPIRQVLLDGIAHFIHVGGSDVQADYAGYLLSPSDGFNGVCGSVRGDY